MYPELIQQNISIDPIFNKMKWSRVRDSVSARAPVEYRCNFWFDTVSGG